MQGRRPGNQSDQKLSRQALAAIAEAARRSRETGDGPEPRRGRPDVLRVYRATDQPVTALVAPHVPRVPPTTPHAGHVPTVPVAANERLAAPEIRWAGFPHPPGGAGFTQSPTGVPRRRTRQSGSGERRLRWAIAIATGVLVVMVAALVGTAKDGDRHPDGQVTATTGSPGPAPR